MSYVSSDLKQQAHEIALALAEHFAPLGRTAVMHELAGEPMIVLSGKCDFAYDIHAARQLLAGAESKPVARKAVAVNWYMRTGRNLAHEAGDGVLDTKEIEVLSLARLYRH